MKTFTKEELKEILAKPDKGEIADLTDADLTGANLRGANLTDADLTGLDLSKAKTLYNVNLAQAKFNYPVYQQALIGSDGRDIIWFPEQDVIFIGCFKGSLKQGMEAIDTKYPLEHKMNKEYKMIISYFQALHAFRRGQK